MKLSDFDYHLPETAIAQHPPSVRGTSKLLVLDKQHGTIAHNRYAHLVDYLQPGDVVVLNNTKVIKARLEATNVNDKPRELLLLEQHGREFDRHHHKVIYRGKIRPQETLLVHGQKIVVEKLLGEGIALVSAQVDLLKLSELYGSIPLPPYMKRQSTKEDEERYQTVFAHKAGSVAAPTASLNFTKELEKKLHDKGVHIEYVTLHVGLGTFLPIRTDNIEDHQMHSEYFEIPAATVNAIQAAKKSGNKVLAVGTTVARTLEYAHGQILNEPPQDLSGEADIFIYPGKHQFQVVDMLLTNFHAPRTTVLMLATAFADWPLLKRAYQTALTYDYRFLSYGDSMLII